jgi:hypothetical protein
MVHDTVIGKGIVAVVTRLLHVEGTSVEEDQIEETPKPKGRLNS